MEQSDPLETARRLAGLSRAELARRAGTSRPTLAAYASGAKAPTLATAQRVLAAAGFRLELAPLVEFGEAEGWAGRRIPVPTALPRLPTDLAMARVRLPLHLNWTTPDREYDLASRRDRARVYEIVLREGTERDILRYIDGALLIDLWPELVLPTNVRNAWAPLVAHYTRGG